MSLFGSSKLTLVRGETAEKDLAFPSYALRSPRVRTPEEERLAQDAALTVFARNVAIVTAAEKVLQDSGGRDEPCVKGEV